MGHTSTTKKEKEWQQSQTAPEHRRTKPDGTPQEPSTTAENAPAAGKEHPQKGTTSTATANPGPTSSTPGKKNAQAASHALGTSKAKGKKREGENGLSVLHGLPPLERHPNANKLNRKAKTDSVTMLAMGYTSRAIVVWLIQNHRVKVSRQNIDSIRNKQRKLIVQTRDILKKDIQKAVPTALKLNRVAIRDEMIQDLRRKPWKGRHEAINRILDSIKAEMEPLEVNLNVDLRAKTAMEYADVSDQGVINQAMSNLKAAGMEIAHVEPPEPKK